MVDAINVSVHIALTIIGVMGFAGALLHFLRSGDLTGEHVDPTRMTVRE